MSAETAYTTQIVAGVVGSVAAVVIFILLLRSHHRRKATRVPTQRPKKKVSSAEIKKLYREALDKIVTARLQRESSTASGEPVFLSHYISQGRLRHWVLHVHRHKYELRQVVDKTYYAAAIAPSEFDLQAYQRSIRVHCSPAVGNYFYSIIGWTTLSKEQVGHKCEQVYSSFGTYALFSNNCHDFLQRLADRIVTTRAPDWRWFRNQAVRGYTYIKQPLFGYDVISAATWSKQLADTKHYLSTAERQEIDNFIHVLEDLVEADLHESSMTINHHMLMMNTAFASAANDVVYYETGNGNGHHGGGDSCGGGGGDGGGG
ncbi:hypothetical protein BJX61DRAFT_518280 [Aspergillus egyptiacus]|nr:hypothetical protein BJX61DRAFT_518280 [Aspergillus egyptiacus]